MLRSYILFLILFLGCATSNAQIAETKSKTFVDRGLQIGIVGTPTISNAMYSLGTIDLAFEEYLNDFYEVGYFMNGGLDAYYRFNRFFAFNFGLHRQIRGNRVKPNTRDDRYHLSQGFISHNLPLLANISLAAGRNAKLFFTTGLTLGIQHKEYIRSRHFENDEYSATVTYKIKPENNRLNTIFTSGLGAEFKITRFVDFRIEGLYNIDLRKQQTDYFLNTEIYSRYWTFETRFGLYVDLKQ